MNSRNRRDFIKRSGLLLGAMFLASNKSICHTLPERNNGLYLDMEEAHVSIVHTGVSPGEGEFFDPSHSPYVPDNAIKLHTGDFTTSGRLDLPVIEKMNALGIQVAALGSQELNLTETELLTLARDCPFMLVNSHLDWKKPALGKWIKPFVVIQVRNKRIGILAIAGNEAAKSQKNRITVEHWAQKLKRQEQVDMVLSLVPPGWNKTELTSWMENSKYIDTFLCAALPDLQGGNRVLKNAEGRDVLLSFGEAEGPGWNKYSCNMAMDGLVLPTQLAYISMRKEMAGLRI